MNDVKNGGIGYWVYENSVQSSQFFCKYKPILKISLLSNKNENRTCIVLVLSPLKDCSSV